MVKKSPHILLSALVILSLIVCTSPLAMAQDAKKIKQYGITKDKIAAEKGEKGALKKNICIDPKLCDSIEIDLLNSLGEMKVVVFLPETKLGKADKESQAALHLGVAVADALASVTKKDKKNFLKNAALVQKYGKQLGISANTLGKYKAITAAADKDQWDKLGLRLYEFKDGMINELNAKNKKALASLAMMSGGLEGFYIAAKSVSDKYSEKGAQLLDNQDLIPYLKNYMATLPPELKNQPGVKALAASMPKLEKLMAGLEANKYSQADVKKIVALAAAMRKNLTGS